MRTLAFAAIILTALSLSGAPSFVDEPGPSRKEDPQVKEARLKYEASIKKANKDYEAAMDRLKRDFDPEFANARKQYVSELMELEQRATKAGELNRATAIRTMRQEAEELPSTSDGGPLKWRPGAVVFKGVQYRIIIGKLDWSDARAVCKKLGGDLAVLDTQEKRTFIGKEVAEIVVHVGASKDNQGKWWWVNGKPVGNEGWAAGRPATFGPKMHIFPSGHLGDGTEQPGDVKGFVCEWPR